MVTGELVACRRVAFGRDDPAARTARRPAPAEPVAEGEGTDAGAMARPALGGVVRLGLGRRQVHRARQLEVIERAPGKLLEPAVRASHPVRAGAVRERHFDTEARVHAVPSAADAYPPTSRWDHSDPHLPFGELR